MIAPIRWQQVRRPCAILLVLVMAHLTAGLFLEDYAVGASQISSPSVRHFALMISQVYDRTMINHPGIRLGIAALVVALLIRALMGRSIGWALDTLGILLCLRCILQFLQLNILLLVPLKAGALLLTQLVLFLPVLIVAFGWLYWRLDGRALGNEQQHLIFRRGSVMMASSITFTSPRWTCYSLSPAVPPPPPQ